MNEMKGRKLSLVLVLLLKSIFRTIAVVLLDSMLTFMHTIVSRCGCLLALLFIMCNTLPSCSFAILAALFDCNSTIFLMQLFTSDVCSESTTASTLVA